MRVDDLIDAEGRVFAFEINSAIFSSKVFRIVSSIAGARITRRPRLHSFDLLELVTGNFEEIVCEFELDGVIFVVWEPFGDNSRYWIGPEPTRWVPQIDRVRDAFAREGRWPFW